MVAIKRPSDSDLLYGSDFGHTLCFERLGTAVVDLTGPHFYSPRGARAWRDAALAFVRLPLPPPGGLPTGAHATLLLRTGDRRFTNENELAADLRTLLQRHNEPPLEVVRLGGTLAFKWQLALYSNTSLLVSPHGAQLTNVVFMPDAAAVIELLTCGYYSDTYRKFAVEAGLRYYASRDPAPGCDRDLGKRHHNDDRPVRRAEIEPLVTRAICGRSNATGACRGVIL